MERIFWVACPQCSGEFFADYEELRFADVDLICPFCEASFPIEESPEIDDRPAR